MRVFQINVDCGCYSTGKIASDLAVSLKKIDSDSIVAYGREYRDTGIKNYRIGNKLDIYYHYGMSKLFDKTGLYSNTATTKLISEIRVFNPDIIHLHNLHGYYINYEILFRFLKDYNRPVVWTLHDCWPFTGHCVYFDYAECDKWKTKCYKCPQLRTYPSSLILDNSEDNYQRKKCAFTSISNLTIVTPSNWLAELVSKSFLNMSTIRVIPNGIDTSVFFKKLSNVYPNKYGVTKKVILGVATPWSERKGLKDFIKLSEKISDEYCVFLVGLSKKQLKEIPYRIIGIEKTLNVQELVELYSDAYVFLNLTYEDNYPTTNLEAQACGTPVITYKTGGSVESCVEKQVVEQGDIDAVVKLIEDGSLSINPNLKISKEQMLQSYVDLYKNIIA